MRHFVRNHGPFTEEHPMEKYAFWAKLQAETGKDAADFLKSAVLFVRNKIGVLAFTSNK